MVSLVLQDLSEANREWRMIRSHLEVTQYWTFSKDGEQELVKFALQSLFTLRDIFYTNLSKKR